jgi:hypothetical protein
VGKEEWTGKFGKGDWEIGGLGDLIKKEENGMME